MTQATLPYCSDLSTELAEPLAGSATPTEVYLLLEYNGAWGEKALEESEIPAELKSRLQAYQKGNPLAKALLIRSTRSLIQPGIRFFVARVAGEVAIYDFHVAAYEDLLELDIPAILDGNPAYARNRRSAPLYLVCTNGRRDRCCARYGVEVFNALLQAVQQDPGFSVWQCSHVGGHRFAANVIELPAGLLYGRVRPEDVPAILSASREKQVYLPNLRGRTVYSQPAQVADAVLRQSLNEPHLEAIRLVDLQPLESDAWLARFERTGGQRYAVHIQAHDTGRQVYESCTMDKLTPTKEFAFQIEELPE